MPTLVVVAGPNGSGKTTMVRSRELALLFTVPVVSVNADDFAKILAGDRSPTDQESLQAAQIADAMVDDLVADRQSFIVETVLSSDKYKSRILTARAAGFDIILVYVSVRDLELNIERVRNRVRLGGHPVPGHRIKARRNRSFQMFSWFARHADKVLVFDNSLAAPAIAAVKGPSGWLARSCGGTNTGSDGPEWMLLRVDLLAPEFADIVRSAAADRKPPDT
jgi:predicted ABC-type ATPase